MKDLKNIDIKLEKELQADVFKALLKHFQDRNDVQNIDLMNLAGFCRNCLSRWFQEAGSKHGINITKDEARKYIYGMEYSKWQKLHQTDASKEQLSAFANNQGEH